MQTIEIKIEDSYIDSVMHILKSLKEDMIQEIHIKKNPPKEDKSKSNLSDFAGMWQDRAIDIDTIRDKAWKKSS